MHRPITPLYLSSDIRRLEQLAPSGSLMAKAGQAIATLAEELAADNADPILIVVGPGNNGGDALVAARLLRKKWHQVIVVLAGDSTRMPPDAANAYQAWLADGGHCIADIPMNTDFGLAIDGLFGIGLQRPLEGRYAALVSELNQLTCPVLSVDIPSGLDADTGAIRGCAVEADYTLTLLGAKPGLYTLEGPDHAGTVIVSDLGINAATVTTPQGWLLEEPMFKPLLPARKLNSHKGIYGDIAVLGGSEGMAGAALLAGRAALLSGAGRVYVGLLAENAPLLDLMQPELMLRHGPDLHEKVEASCVVIGPGLGRTPQAVKSLRAWLDQPVPLVLDADALQLLGQNPAFKAVLQQRSQPVVITPHPGEAGALLGCNSSEIQQDRVRSALKLAEKYKAITLLKGAGTVIAEPNGNWYINTTGNPGLSSAGTGDVLAGMIGAFIGQELQAGDAARHACWLHGAAADELAAHGTGPVGLTASEVALKARTLLNRSFLAHPAKH